MIFSPQILLLGAVVAVGVLHTIVPDHWVPITLIARQRGWTRRQTARAALFAGTGHVLTTLLLGVVVWAAGVVVAARFGHVLDTASSVALIAFGAWFGISAWRDLHAEHKHGHGHSHDFSYMEGQIHGPELKKIPAATHEIELSIYEKETPPCFRVTGANADRVSITTVRENGARQIFQCVNKGEYWESAEIPEPHQFAVTLTTNQGDAELAYTVQFTEGEHGHGHEHGHTHDHAASSHTGKQSTRTTLLLILGSSPMIEGIPAFFAAGKYGFGLILLMSILFAVSTIATYVLLSVYSTAGLSRVKFPALERYGEVLSGAFIALLGLVFFIWPVL